MECIISRPGVIVICNSNDYNCSSNSIRKQSNQGCVQLQKSNQLQLLKIFQFNYTITLPIFFNQLHLYYAETFVNYVTCC